MLPLCNMIDGRYRENVVSKKWIKKSWGNSGCFQELTVSSVPLVLPILDVSGAIPLSMAALSPRPGQLVTGPDARAARAEND